MNPEPPRNPRDEMEARITALLLGELSTYESESVREAIARDPALAKLHEELKRTIPLVRESVHTPAEEQPADSAPLKLSDMRRQKLLAQFKTVPLPGQARTRQTYRLRILEVAALFAIVALLAAMLLPALSKAKNRAQSVAILSNLRQLDAAKQQWAMENNKSAQATPTFEDIKPYFGRGDAGTPPPVAGETYVLGKVGEPASAEMELKKAERISRTPAKQFGESPANQLVRLNDEGKWSLASQPASGLAGKFWSGDAADRYPLNAPASSKPDQGGVHSANVVGFVNVQTKGEAHPVAENELLESHKPPAAKTPSTPIILPSSDSGNFAMDFKPETGLPTAQTPPVENSGGRYPVANLRVQSSGSSAEDPSLRGGGGGVGGGDAPMRTRGFSLLGPIEPATGISGSVNEPTSSEDPTAIRQIRDLPTPNVRVEGKFADVGQNSNQALGFDWNLANRGTTQASGGTIPADGYNLALPNQYTFYSRRSDDADIKVLGAADHSSDANRNPVATLVPKDTVNIVLPATSGVADDSKKNLAAGAVAEAVRRQAVRIKGKEHYKAAPGAGASLAANDSPSSSSVSVNTTNALAFYSHLSGKTVLSPQNLPDAKIVLETGKNANSNETLKALNEELARKGVAMVAVGDKFVKAVPVAQAGQEGAPVQQLDMPVRTPSTNAPIPQPEIQTSDNNFSTFSLNVSDVSFKLAAASLEKGQMPDPASIRSEEFINAFDYRDPEATPNSPVAFAWERSAYPFAHNRDLLRFSIKTAAMGRQAGRPLNIVLLLDNSGSMERADRVQIIREALRQLAGQLQPQDKISVIVFARTARLIADGAPGNEAGAISMAVSELTPQGGTNLEDAMNLAYQTAARHYLANGINRVVLLTDGAANLGDVKPESLKQKVETERQQGIALDCFGIGWEGFNDDLLEVLSRNGDGRYGFINSPEEAATEFAGKLAGALKIAASDVKVQVEFNPQRVTAFRQIGYAKHQLTKEQFRDNTVDAAEIAALEAGNALYTIAANPGGSGPLCTVRVRYKIPGTTDYREQSWDVPYTGNAVALEQSSPAMRLAASASAFSEWLAVSPFAGEVTPDQLLTLLRGVPETYGADPRPKKLEWMIREAGSIEGK